jgi:hypothetical protein
MHRIAHYYQHPTPGRMCGLTCAYAALLCVKQAEREAVVEGRSRLRQQLMSQKLGQIR